MAKKKKGAAQVKISPEKYVKERARKFPIVQCLINKNWKEAGEGNILIARQRPDGDLIIGMYLVDLYCLGVKDAFVIAKGTQEDIDRFAEGASEGGEMEPISYNEAHNLIYGAIEFAEEGGIEPHPDFELAEYILEEDTDDIPLIEFEYGHNGKHLLVVSPSGKERKYISVLHNHLGDKYDVIEPSDDFPYHDDEEDYNQEHKYGGGWSDLPYTYQHPDFPEKLSIRHRFIAEAFYSNNNYYSLPEDVINRIMALPHDEAVADINAIAFYEIGRGYDEYDKRGELTVGNDQSALLHSAVMLTQLGGKVAEDTLFEMMRMPFDMADYYFSDIVSEYFPAMLYSVGEGKLDRIVEYLYEKGLSREIQDSAFSSLSIAVAVDPSRRDEVIDILRRMFKDMKEKIPAKEVWTDESAGYAVALAADIRAVELLPEIKELYDLDLVDPTVIGEYGEAESEVRNGGGEDQRRAATEYPFDVRAFYNWNREYFSEEEESLADTGKDIRPIDDVEFA